MFVTSLFVFQSFSEMIHLLIFHISKRNRSSNKQTKNRSHSRRTINPIDSIVCVCHEYIDDAGKRFILKQLESVYRKRLFEWRIFLNLLRSRYTETVFSYRTQQLLVHISTFECICRISFKCIRIRAYYDRQTLILNHSLCSLLTNQHEFSYITIRSLCFALSIQNNNAIRTKS